MILQDSIEILNGHTCTFDFHPHSASHDGCYEESVANGINTHNFLQ